MVNEMGDMGPDGSGYLPNGWMPDRVGHDNAGMCPAYNGVGAVTSRDRWEIRDIIFRFFAELFALGAAETG